MNSFDIRQKFLDYFKKRGHEIIPSSSLIPAQDPTLLFANAGMNQFKDIFLGKETRSYKRATTIQKCVRAGGKHNDLDEVGFTNRHLTFFEMMGNFSFGDYFKKEAIEFAWEFLTKEAGIPAERMVITIYKDDEQAYDIWTKTIKIPHEKITRLGERENFWQMGDTGPCGPCTEIHIDNGNNVGCKKLDCSPACSCGRFTEIWNLVFMQFDRQTDGKLIPLKKTGVDTGMGLERLCMILQGKGSVFETDLFQPLIKKLEELTGINYKKSPQNIKSAFNVLLDHARSSSLLIADGCAPSNEGRGYVLRKIIRRAALFSQKLSANPKLFSAIANEFTLFMSPIYSELKTSHNLIVNLIESEIERFTTNLIQGQNILEKFIEEALEKREKILSGKQVFKLYDTYGFPPELTRVMAHEKNLSLDMAGFETEMQKQQELSGKKEKVEKAVLQIPETISTNFVGYEKLEVKSKINFVHQEDSYIWLVTEESPFYVESGGQVSDQGFVIIQEHTFPILEFSKISKNLNPAIVIKISTKDISNIKIKVGDVAHCIVDYVRRTNSAKNHTATHLLQAALVQILGKQIKQSGSFVNDQYLRFDFTYHQALTKEEVEKVEDLVNQKIQENIKLNIFFTTLKKATEQGVTAFFGEKYNPECVRVVQIPNFSSELCGGTHVDSTGVIGCFKIDNQEALSAGTRRITALTGPSAIKLFQQDYNVCKVLSEKFKVKPDHVLKAIEKQQEEITQMKHEIKHLKKMFWKAQIPSWQKKVKLAGKVPFLFLEIEDLDGSQFKQLSEEIESKTPGFYFVISKNSKTPEILNFFGFLSHPWEKEVNLKDLINFLKEKFEFKGGGSTNLIQGSGPLKDNLEKEITKWIKLI